MANSFSTSARGSKARIAPRFASDPTVLLESLWFRIWGSGFRIDSSDCGVEDSGCIAQGWEKREWSDLKAPDVYSAGSGSRCMVHGPDVHGVGLRLGLGD